MTKSTDTHMLTQISPAEALKLLEETLSYFTPAPARVTSDKPAPEYVPYAA